MYRLYAKGVLICGTKAFRDFSKLKVLEPLFKIVKELHYLRKKIEALISL